LIYEIVILIRSLVWYILRVGLNFM
jgi:hypothetical protein